MPHTARALQPVSDFVFDVRQLKRHAEKLFLFTSTSYTDLLNPGDTVVVDGCGGCPKCSLRDWMLFEVEGKFVIERKIVMLPYIRRSLRLVGDSTRIAKPIGRILAWRTGNDVF